MRTHTAGQLRTQHKRVKPKLAKECLALHIASIVLSKPFAPGSVIRDHRGHTYLFLVAAQQNPSRKPITHCADGLLKALEKIRSRLFSKNCRCANEEMFLTLEWATKP